MSKKIKFSVFIATSLDGFISREGGSIDWLMKFNETVPPDEDCGYREFISSIDLIVMGRKTFEQVLTFKDWPYKGKKLTVLSRTLQSVPEYLQDTVTVDLDTPGNLALKLSSLGYQHIYVDGGTTIQGFLNEGVIDEITITTIPVLIGKGRPLFGSLDKDVNLKLIQGRSYSFGATQAKYQIV